MAWVVYMLTAAEQTAGEGIATILAIKKALLEVKHRIRDHYPFAARTSSTISSRIRTRRLASSSVT